MSSKKKALQVAVHCRPPGRGEGSAVVSADGGSCSVQSGDECAVFSFDRSFGPEESQHAVYDALVARLADAAPCATPFGNPEAGCNVSMESGVGDAHGPSYLRTESRTGGVEHG